MRALLSHAEVAEDRTGSVLPVLRTAPGTPPGHSPPRAQQKVVAMRWEAFLDQVQERGEYGTRQEAERAARTVLALLGAHLVGEVRAALAARLPDTFALILLNPLQAEEPLSAERFVRATAAWIEGANEQTATWDVSAVLSVTADAAGRELTRRILFQLPPGYDLLFGRPQNSPSPE
jgi:uncharacterized protein (DUF2267 family)